MGWVKALERYCSGAELSLDGLQEKIAGIPPDAVRDSRFFHYACMNEKVTLEIVKCLLRVFPEAVRSTDRAGSSPLHYACYNKNMNPRIVRVLLDAWPESVNHRSNMGGLPLHILCETGGSVDETASLAVLELLLAAAPLSVTIADGTSALPIHTAIICRKSYSFCKMLIDSYPESLRVRDSVGGLPIHDACGRGNVELVELIIERDPDSIGSRDRGGDLPIHYAAGSNGQHKIDIIRYLLAMDPDCASKTGAGGQRLPLHVACGANCIESVRLLFDAYPEAIDSRDRNNETPLEVARERENDAIVEFLEAQLSYARQAEDVTALTTSDENGWLPLHRALRINASLGAIKLLIAGNPSALQVPDNESVFPLHIACEFSTADIVQHLLGLLDIHLHTLDLQMDSTLHYACRGGNTGVVKYLLERGVPSVSEPNNRGKLPIHLLWESGRVDRNSVEYVDAVRRLLLAHPESVAL